MTFGPFNLTLGEISPATKLFSVADNSEVLTYLRLVLYWESNIEFLFASSATLLAWWLLTWPEEIFHCCGCKWEIWCRSWCYHRQIFLFRLIIFFVREGGRLKGILIRFSICSVNRITSINRILLWITTIAINFTNVALGPQMQRICKARKTGPTADSVRILLWYLVQNLRIDVVC